MTLEQIANLTDRSLEEVYFHKRSKYGSIEVPMPTSEAAEEIAAEPTLESTLAELQFLHSGRYINDEDFQRCKVAAEAKYGQQNQGAGEAGIN